MMHEINVIRSPGGCFSLFVNVPCAENMPRAVSAGWQNSKKPFLQTLQCHGSSLTSTSQGATRREVYLPFSLPVSFYSSPSWPAFDNGMPSQDEHIFPNNLEHFPFTSKASFLSWIRRYPSLALSQLRLFCRKKWLQPGLESGRE